MEQQFTFEVVTVDDTGQIVAREIHTGVQVVETLDGGVALERVVIPGGAFLMGSRAGQGYDDEHPQHSVRVPSFLLGKFPVTQEQWGAVMGRLPPCRCRGARRPVDRVSWDDAQAFCARLAKRTGRPYRLPAEARLLEANRQTIVRKAGFADAVVWNPGAAKCATMADLEPEDYRRFVCVEAAAVGAPIHLMSGERWQGSQTLCT